MRTASRLPVVLAMAAALALSGCGKSPTPQTASSPATSQATTEGAELTIAIAGMVTPASGLDYYLGLSEYVGRKVGKPVRLIHKSDYAQVNEMLKEGKVDIAYVCSGPYVSGHDEFGLQLVAAPVVNGKPAYFSYFIVSKESTATALDSLKGKSFAYTDPKSNTGCLVPNYMLATAGYTPSTFFKETFFTYGHDNSIKAVASGKADAAAVDSLIYDYLAATGSKDTTRTRIIFKSEEFATPPVAARPGLDPALLERIRAAFLGASDDPEGKSLLDKMKIDRFTLIEDSAYDSIRQMNERLQ